jgi:DNA (cytosine-5)-methyltransferase 1
VAKAPPRPEGLKFGRESYGRRGKWLHACPAIGIRGAPRYVFAENVQRRAIDRAADDLDEMGYATRAVPLSAEDMGADHVRERFWLLAYADMHGELHKPVHAEVAVLQSIHCRVWESDPAQPRMADGLAARLDRLAATGNGQVPAVAATAFSLLSANYNEPR